MTQQSVSAESRTKKRVRLNRELIIQTALELASRPGVSSLRIRDLGKELGVDPSAIYRHFQSKNALMKALVETVGAATLAGVKLGPPEEWRRVLTEIAEVGLELYLRYPAIGSDGAAVMTDATDIVEAILAAFHDAGLRDQQLVDHYLTFASYVLSFSGTIARSRSEYGSDMAEQPWAGDVLKASPETHPVANTYRELVLAKRDTDVYRTGVTLILNSAEQTAASSPQAFSGEANLE